MGARRSRNFLRYTNIKWRQKPECSAGEAPSLTRRSSAVPLRRVGSSAGVEQEAALGVEKTRLDVPQCDQHSASALFPPSSSDRAALLRPSEQRQDRETCVLAAQEARTQTLISRPIAAPVRPRGPDQTRVCV